MFQNLKEIKSKNAQRDKINRFEYLEYLANEYKETKVIETKRNLCAHLSNFTYDPINNEWLRKLNVMQLFLEGLKEEDESIKKHCINALANCASGKKEFGIILL